MKQTQQQQQEDFEFPEFDQRSELIRNLKKAKMQGLDKVVDFLRTKARKSPRTARLYYHGLDDLSSFIKEEYDSKYDIQTIIPAIKKKRVDIYTLLNLFISYLQKQNDGNFMPRSIALYVSATKSYFAFYDIDISREKFRYRVTLPAISKVDEAAIDANDIRNIIQHCSNRRLKAYLLVLGSGGMRAMEALGIRERDIDFSSIDLNDPNDTSEPAMVHIRSEFSKSKHDRNIFISNEAARYLNEWIVFKYHSLRNPAEARKQGKDDLVFSRGKPTTRYPIGLYDKIALEFRSVLEAAGFSSRKEEGVCRRREVTLHSFRRYVRTVIGNQAKNGDYGEWFLGHKKSSYYVNKPDELKRIYKDDVMKYVTFLSYATVEATGRSFEAQLKGVVKQKDEEIAELKRKVSELTSALDQSTSNTKYTTDRINEFQREIDSLKDMIDSGFFRQKKNKNKKLG